MAEPVDVQDGGAPVPGQEQEEHERKHSMFAPLTDEQKKVKTLQEGVAAARAAIEPDRKPPLEDLPDVQQTLKDVSRFKQQREENFKRSPPPTPTTPITPSTRGYGYPKIDPLDLIAEAPVNHQPVDENDGKLPPTLVQAAIVSMATQEEKKPFTFNRERAALVLLDAFATGDEAASLKWKTSTSSIQRYRRLLTEDPKFVKIVSLRMRELEQSWAVARMQCLRSIIKRIENLASTSDDIYRLSGAVKILGELQVVAGVLSAGSESADQGSGDEEAPRRATRGPGPVHEKLDK